MKDLTIRVLALGYLRTGISYRSVNGCLVPVCKQLPPDTNRRIQQALVAYQDHENKT